LPVPFRDLIYVSIWLEFRLLPHVSVEWGVVLTVYSRRTQDRCLDSLITRFQHDFIDVLMESIFRQFDKILHVGQVVVFPVRPLA
jgi:hypothetical protein